VLATLALLVKHWAEPEAPDAAPGQAPARGNSVGAGH
jgi:hypothetical protein